MSPRRTTGIPGHRRAGQHAQTAPVLAHTTRDACCECNHSTKRRSTRRRQFEFPAFRSTRASRRRAVQVERRRVRSKRGEARGWRAGARRRTFSALHTGPHGRRWPQTCTSGGRMRQCAAAHELQTSRRAASSRYGHGRPRAAPGGPGQHGHSHRLPVHKVPGASAAVTRCCCSGNENVRTLLPRLCTPPTTYQARAP